MPILATAGRAVSGFLSWFYQLRLTAALSRISFAIALVVLAASPRSTVVIFWLLFAIAASVLVAARIAPLHWLADWRRVAALIAFAFFALLSTLWSLDRGASLGKSIMLLGAIVAALVAIRSAPATQRPVLAAAVQGLMLGFLVQLAGIAFETLTDQRLARAVLQAFPALQEGPEKHVFVTDGTVVRVSEAEISRRICVGVLFLVPILFAMRRLLAGRVRVWALGTVAALAGVVLLLGQHQSSQLAMVAGLVAAGVWRWSPQRAMQIAMAGWCIGALLAVPIARELHGAGLSESPRLFKSARERIVIWGTTAARVPQNWWTGIGADATTAARDLDAKAAAGGKAPKEGEFQRTVGRHAHNAFLQVWLELGAIGAVLFALVGVSALRILPLLPPALGAAAYAQLAVIAVMLSSSYGMWQLWLQSAIGLSVVMLAMAHIAATNGSAFAMPRRN